MKNTLILVLTLFTITFSADLYVRSDGSGDDGGSGHDGSTFALAWATLQYALDNISAGDNLFICSSSGTPFTITATVDVDMNNGGNTAPTKTTRVNVIGADLVDGSPYNGAGQAYITTSTTLASGLLLLSDYAPYFKYVDINFNGGGTGAAAYCVQGPNTDNCSMTWFINCTFTNSTNHCILFRMSGGSSNAWGFINCDIYGSLTGAGLWSHSDSRAYAFVNGCKIHDNYTYGARLGGGGVLCFGSNAVYNNGNSGENGVHLTSTGQMMITNCVFYNNDGSGIFVNDATNCNPIHVYNNIFRNNGAYGINMNGIDSDMFGYIDYNCYSGNTTNPIDILSGTPPGTHNVTSDPLFTSETLGYEDFTLQTGSPCLNTGIGY